MIKWYILHENNWLRRLFLGGLSALGVASTSPDNIVQSQTPSNALQEWISGARRKETRDGYSIAELTDKPSDRILLAAHRSHSSHASHFSSQTGHRSHYSSYTSTPTELPKQPLKETPKQSPKETPKKSEIPEVTNKTKSELIIQAKAGKVKSIISPTTFILEDATIVDLIGVKMLEYSNLKEKASAADSVQASLSKWIGGKTIRFIPLKGNKGYVFVFINELECRCINLELVREGRLMVDSDPSIFAHQVLLNAQKEAQDKSLGIWSKNTASKAQKQPEVPSKYDIELELPQKNKDSTSIDKKRIDLVIDTKTGTVKSITSPTVFILEDATIVELIGVKMPENSDLQEKIITAFSANTTLSLWIDGKPIRYNPLDGNKAYGFVFINELEYRCINLELVREGKLAVDGNTRIIAHQVLLNAQKEAQDKSIGIWRKK